MIPLADKRALFSLTMQYVGTAKGLLLMNAIKRCIYALTGGIYAAFTVLSGLVFIAGMIAVIYGVASPDLRDSIVSIGAPLKVLSYFGIGFTLITLAVHPPNTGNQ
ncbi:MAG: hypothetical protein D3903_14090 [Candidatus Electrothrix sp. GM3_4]|nr:hypothetical protein [Candidatus Electrothrix sp. GM3_4]